MTTNMDDFMINWTMETIYSTKSYEEGIYETMTKKKL